MRIIVSVALILLLAPPRPFGRDVVITFDDLPVGGIVDFSIDELHVITRDLIASIRRNQIPATLEDSVYQSADTYVGRGGKQSADCADYADSQHAPIGSGQASRAARGT